MNSYQKNAENVIIHLGYRLTTDLAQRRRDAEKDRKSFSLRLCAKNITKQIVTLVSASK